MSTYWFSRNDFGMEPQSGWGLVFDEIKSKEGLKSDAALAQSLGVSRAFICAVRKNRKGVSNEIGMKLYRRLGRPITESDLGLFMSTRVQKLVARQTYLASKEMVLKRANGICELCTKPAPFVAPDGKPYLEIHHLLPLVLNGSSGENNLVALCPNCHRKLEICPSVEDITKTIAHAGLNLDKDQLRLIIESLTFQ